MNEHHVSALSFPDILVFPSLILYYSLNTVQMACFTYCCYMDFVSCKVTGVQLIRKILILNYQNTYQHGQTIALFVSVLTVSELSISIVILQVTIWIIRTKEN